MNSNTIITLFKNIDADYKIDEETASYILKWFLFQDLVPHTEEKLEDLIDMISSINIYEKEVRKEDLRSGEFTLTDIFFECGYIETSDERYRYEL